MNLPASLLFYLPSGLKCSFDAVAFFAILVFLAASYSNRNNKLFTFLCPVFASALPAVGDAGTIQHPANNMVTNARQIPHPSASYHYRAVFLQIMVNSRYISRNFFAVGQPNTRNLPQSRIGLLGRHRPDNQAYPSFLGRTAYV
jgi:hypothetical protein